MYFILKFAILTFQKNGKFVLAKSGLVTYAIVCIQVGGDRFTFHKNL